MSSGRSSDDQSAASAGDHSQEPGARRVFVAVPIPVEIREGLTRVRDALRPQVPRHSVRWVHPEHIHLTLRFIGNVSARDVGLLQESLSRAVLRLAPFELELGSAGVFPSVGPPRVLWVGLGGALEALHHLQVRVLDTTAAWGEVETRAFHPHLTLGRVKTRRRDEARRIAAAVRQVTVPRASSWRVDSVDLMRSQLASGGAVYSTLASVPLDG
jgi:2'-5' RNA ligase